MGKGGCEIAEFGMGMVRSIIGCACCMVCMGPLLLIIGVVMLVSPNNYAQMVSDYNAAAATFNAFDKANMQGSSGTMNGISLSVSTSTQPISSASALPTGDTVQSGIVSVSLSTPTTTTIPASGSLTDSGSRTSAISTSSISATSGWQTLTNLRCPSRSGSSYCYQSDMQSVCATAAGCSSSSVTWTFSGSSTRCSDGTTCYGTCTYRVVQLAQCSTIKHTNVSGFSIAANSCMYPFGSSNQPTQCSSGTIPANSTSAAMKIMFLSDKDPFVAAQRITSGSMSFGLTEAQQRSIGLVLMVIGIIIIALLVGMCVLIKKTFFKNDESKRRMYGAFGQSYNGQPVYVYGQPQQPYYAQQDVYVVNGAQQQQQMMMMNQQQPYYGQQPQQQQQQMYGNNNNGYAPAPGYGNKGPGGYHQPQQTQGGYYEQQQPYF